MVEQRRKKSLMRNLGEFFGHIMHAVKSDPRKQIVHRTTQEEPAIHDEKVILRRTTIEEIEIRGD